MIAHDLNNDMKYAFVNTTAIDALEFAAMMEDRIERLVDEELLHEHHSRVV